MQHYLQANVGKTSVRAHGPLAGIVLAAGLSSRMGEFKPVMRLGGVPLVVHVVRAIASVEEVHPLVVVTGHEAEQVEGALRGFAVTFVHNEKFAEGEMLSSLRAGIAALPANVGGVVLAFADQPGVAPDTVRQLVRAWRGSTAPLVMPVHVGRRGHPVVISASMLPEIKGLSGSETLKDLVHRHMGSALQVAVDDRGVVEDMDTREDYERLRESWGEQRAAVTGETT